jgi:signal transduction histidine kinase
MSPTESTFDIELQRVKSLSEFDLEYDKLQPEFENLTRLAASIASTDIALVNLIDTYTQWTVSHFGMAVIQMPREESVCNYTIQQKDYFEVRRLDLDPRFCELDLTVGENGLKYYLGFPLTTITGERIGALCVVDKDEKQLSEQKIDQLKIIAEGIVELLQLKKELNKIGKRANDAIQTKNKIVHDIRGPLNGIIGLTELALDEESNPEETREFMQMIHEAGTNMRELTEDILNEVENSTELKNNYFTPSTFSKRLEALYGPQARFKKVKISFRFNEEIEDFQFSRKKLLQIAGNLISNAIKFTDKGGEVLVNLDIDTNMPEQKLLIEVKDSGTGITFERMEELRAGTPVSADGTLGEKGFGLGIKLVFDLVQSLNGTMNISSKIGNGTNIKVEIPLK